MMAKHAAETADAIVRTALTLFSGDGTGESGVCSFRGEPYELPGDDQLRLTGADTGCGNRMPDAGAFSADEVNSVGAGDASFSKMALTSTLALGMMNLLSLMVTSPLMACHSLKW